ncbi:MAG: type II secretion system protein GspC [Woeseia sp.]
MTIEAKWSDFSSFDGERTLAAANQILPRWVTLALVIAIAWQLARIIWMLMPGSSAGDPILVAPGQASIGATQARANVQAIADAHIFGEASADGAPLVTEPEVPVDLAETRQNLSLKGTIATVQPDGGLAIIADGRNEEKVYAIRDTVMAGTTLHAVYPDRVVLNESGALRALKLPKEFPQVTASLRRSTTAVNRASAGQSIQTVVAQNVARLADVIRPTPYMVGGQMQGYRVYPGRNRKQFAALGLRPGDLIKDIDGAALTDPQQAIQIFQSLGDADQVSVTIERNGQPQSLILKTSQLQLGDNLSQ